MKRTRTILALFLALSVAGIMAYAVPPSVVMQPLKVAYGLIVPANIDKDVTFTFNALTLKSGITVTAGGITATAGDITATADDIVATAGDIIATAGDVTVTAGNIVVTAGTITTTAADIIATAGDFVATAGDFIATAGDVTITAGDLDITAGDIDMASGDINALAAILVQTSNASNVTVTAAQTNIIFIAEAFSSDGSDMIFDLPTAVAGLIYTFIDNDPDAGSDLLIQANTGDTINGGTAAKLYECTGDAVKQSVTIVAADATQWLVVNEVGTWVNNNS